MFLKTLRTFIYKALHRQARQLLLVTSVTIDTWATVSITRALAGSFVQSVICTHSGQSNSLMLDITSKFQGLEIMDLCLKLYFSLYIQSTVRIFIIFICQELHEYFICNPINEEHVRLTCCSRLTHRCFQTKCRFSMVLEQHGDWRCCLFTICLCSLYRQHLFVHWTKYNNNVF